MKKYLDKTEEEKVAGDIIELNEWFKHYGSMEKFIEHVAKRHTFINTRCAEYRRALESNGLQEEILNAS